MKDEESKLKTVMIEESIKADINKKDIPIIEPETQLVRHAAESNLLVFLLVAMTSQFKFIETQ